MRQINMRDTALKPEVHTGGNGTAFIGWVYLDN